MKAELRGLPKELAAIVAAHLEAAGSLIEDDPALAFEHAMAARRRAARLPAVREAAAETAYAAEEFATALTEYRALHRMNGDPNYLPVMADCERALGKPQAALKLLKEAESAPLDPTQRLEAILVEAGARDDLGQRAEALRLLKATIIFGKGPREAQARVRYAYAALLEESGQAESAAEWFRAAEKFDDEGQLDADERVGALEGLTIEFAEEEPTEDEDGDILPEYDESGSEVDSEPGEETDD